MAVTSSDTSSNGWVPELFAQGYYRYGLLLATHPWKLILLATATFLFLSSPLYYLPLPGYLPQEYLTPKHNYSVPISADVITLSPSSTPTPLWYQGPPLAYILQIVVRSSVGPVTARVPHPVLTVSDSYRGPLSTAFDLLQTLNEYQYFSHPRSHDGVPAKNRSGEQERMWLSSQCLLVEDVIKQLRGEREGGELLPHFNCLQLSPADLWTRDKSEFIRDPHVLSTIKGLMASHEGQSKVADVLFGVPSSEIGLLHKKHPRVITYAFTLALRTYNEEFIEGLKDELVRRYPLHQDTQPHAHQITHLYFPLSLSLWEVLIFLLFCALFFSTWFSLRKIDILTNQFLIAVTVLVTFVSSLCLAVGSCAYFGLKPLHSQLKYLYPVLAGLVGFENSMVLIHTLASMPRDLDVKIRLAKGLAREGWTITKYFLTMITLLTFSFFLFMPLVQEICIYLSLAMLCDLYMQLVFLAAVLSIDLQRGQDDQKHLKDEMLDWAQTTTHGRYGGFRWGSIRTLSSDHNAGVRTGIPNLHRRHAVAKTSTAGEDRVAPPSSAPTKAQSKLPKRLRITYFVTSKRLFQRMIMCVFIGWIAWMIYNTTGLFEDWEKIPETGPDLASVLHSIKTKSSERVMDENTRSGAVSSNHYNNHGEAGLVDPVMEDLHLNEALSKLKKKNSDRLLSLEVSRAGQHDTGAFDHLRHVYPDLTEFLPPTHWPTLFGYYNISLRGQYVSLLPPILLSIPVSVDDALSVHHSGDPNDGQWTPPEEPNPFEEKDPESWWVAVMSGADRGAPQHPQHRYPSVFPFGNRNRGGRYGRKTPFIPSSSGEMLVTCILAIPAVGVLVYATIFLYRCMCSRNYAEWREQWWRGEQVDARAQIIGECVPLSLTGHCAEVECVCTDGAVVVSACLEGSIRVWDPLSTECIAVIDRSLASRRLKLCTGQNCCSDYESGSPKSLAEPFSLAHHATANILQHQIGLPEYQISACQVNPFADLSKTIRTDFVNMYSSNRLPSTCSRSRAVSFIDQQAKEYFESEQNRKLLLSNSALRRNYSTESLFATNALESDPHSFLHSHNDISRHFQHVHVNAHPQRPILSTTFSQEHIPSHVPSLILPPYSAGTVFQGVGNTDVGFHKTHKRNLSAGNPPLFVSGSARWLQAAQARMSNPHAIGNVRPQILRDDAEKNFQKCHMQLASCFHGNTYSTKNSSTEESAPCCRKDSAPTRCSSGTLRCASCFQKRCCKCQRQRDSVESRRATSLDRVPAVWALECQDGLVMVGCSDGRIEIWDAYNGKLKFICCDDDGVGVTSMTVSGNRLVVARLSGMIDIFTVHVADTSNKECYPNVTQTSVNIPLSCHSDYSSPTQHMSVRTYSCHAANSDCLSCIERQSTCSQHDHYSCSQSRVIDTCDHKDDEGGYAESSDGRDDDDNLTVWLIRDVTSKVHHQPISVLCCDSTKILTGSHDHTLKLLRLSDGSCQFTLHGHLGPITAATFGTGVSPCLSGNTISNAVPDGGHQRKTSDHHILQISPLETDLRYRTTAIYGDDPSEGVLGDRSREIPLRRAQSFEGQGQEGDIIASGAQDGSLCVWDVTTGTGMYSVSGHRGAVLSIATSSSYLISLGADERLAVWERFQGHLLNTLHMSAGTFCSRMIMLTSKLLITARLGKLCVWDVSSGLQVLEVSLDSSVVSTGSSSRKKSSAPPSGAPGESVLTCSAVFPRHLLTVGANVICDYGSTLRVVRMPVAEKVD